jgi:proteasome lid subunit RPN8/RPN11
LIHATRQRLGLVGSWHSHPDASSALSTKDLATIKVYAQDDRARFVPTLAVVVADGIDVHLEA